jgi:hypothetical protein
MKNKKKMKTEMFYYKLLLFYKVGTWTISKHPQLLPCKLLQVLIWCGNPDVWCYLSNNLPCILLVCSISALSANRKRLYKIEVNNKIDEEYKFSRCNKEAYQEVIPHNPLHILVVDVGSKGVITPRRCITSRLRSCTVDHTRIVQMHEPP